MYLLVGADLPLPKHTSNSLRTAYTSIRPHLLPLVIPPPQTSAYTRVSVLHSTQWDGRGMAPVSRLPFYVLAVLHSSFLTITRILCVTGHDVTTV